MIRQGTEKDLETLGPLVDAARVFARAPYLTVSSEYTRQTIATGLRAGTSALIVDGDPIHSFAWVEMVRGDALLIHQIYASPGQRFDLMFQAIDDYARFRHCAQVMGLAYAISVGRLARRRGFHPTAVLMTKKVV